MTAGVGRSCTRSVVLVAALAASSCARAAAPAPEPVPPLEATAAPGTRVLVFTRNDADRQFARQQGLPETGISEAAAARGGAIQRLGERHGFVVDHTEDYAAFSEENLRRYAAVVFAGTGGNVLAAAQEAAFERWLRGGGGLVALGLTSMERDWSWFHDAIGASFAGIAHASSVTVLRADGSHLSTRSIPRRWTLEDGWLRHTPLASDARVLATLDPRSWPYPNPGTRSQRLPPPPYPVIWCRAFQGGRVWYSGLGHSEQSYTDAAFLNHLAGGILWVADREGRHPCGMPAP